MKKTISLFTGLVMLLFVTGKVYASPVNENKAENNPNVVAYYDNGTHSVIQPDGTIWYYQPGKDLVQQAGSNFQQFYEDPDGNRIHTLFRNVGDGTSCPEGWLFIENPYDPPVGDTWGYYFPPGDNYCVKSNFQVQSK